MGPGEGSIAEKTTMCTLHLLWLLYVSYIRIVFLWVHQQCTPLLAVCSVYTCKALPAWIQIAAQLVMHGLVKQSRDMPEGCEYVSKYLPYTLSPCFPIYTSIFSNAILVVGGGQRGKAPDAPCFKALPHCSERHQQQGKAPLVGKRSASSLPALPFLNTVKGSGHRELLKLFSVLSLCQSFLLTWVATHCSVDGACFSLRCVATLTLYTSTSAASYRCSLTHR